MAERRKISLRERLILNYVIVSILAILMAGAFSYYIARQALMERTLQQLTSVKMAKKKQVEDFLHQQIRDLNMLARTDFVHQLSAGISGQGGATDYPENCRPGISFFREYMAGNPFCRGIYIGTPNAAAFVSFEKSDSTVTEGTNRYFTSIPESLFDSVRLTGRIFIHDELQSPVHGLTILSRINSGTPGGGQFIAIHINGAAIDTLMLEYNDTKGLGRSGESYLIGLDDRLRTHSRFSEEYFLQKIPRTEGIQRALTGMEGTGSYTDYRGVTILGSYSYIRIAGITWGILAEMDYQEALVPVFQLRANILILTIFIALGVFLFTFFISRKITRPLVELTHAVSDLREGQVTRVDLPPGHDEVHELAEQFNQMASELGQKRNELIVERLQRVRAMIDGQEQERQRLSRELHDGIGQYLAALKMRLQGIPLDDPITADRKVHELMVQVDYIIEEIRRVTFDLRPALLDEIGLKSAIQALCTSASRPGSTDFLLSSGELPDTLDRSVQTYIFRIIQECIHNILKHSHAQKAHISLIMKEERLHIRVDDDGEGFNTASAMKGSGLHNIRERVNLLSGTIEISSISGKGTSIRISIPVDHE